MSSNTNLQHSAIYCNTVQHTATQCNTVLHAATHCNALQHIKTLFNLPRPWHLPPHLQHCDTLRHTATHCNTLQHTATHCNTLQPLCTLAPPISTWGVVSLPLPLLGAPLSIVRELVGLKAPKLGQSATHCNTHCNALQHTATHYNTLAPPLEQLLAL